MGAEAKKVFLTRSSLQVAGQSNVVRNFERKMEMSESLTGELR